MTLETPDLKYVTGTCEHIAKRLRAGQLIVLESTTYPTTTRDVMLPILEAGGLKRVKTSLSRTVLSARIPETRSSRLLESPRVVGAINDASLTVASKLYSAAVAGVIPVSSCEVAEASKVLEKHLSRGEYRACQ